MDEKTLITGGVGIGSGLIGAVLTALGFKSRLERVERAHDEMKKAVVFKDVCEVCQRANNALVISLKEDIAEVKQIIKDDRDHILRKLDVLLKKGEQ